MAQYSERSYVRSHTRIFHRYRGAIPDVRGYRQVSWENADDGRSNAVIQYTDLLMARLPRLVVPDHPHHVLQIGIDRQSIFRDDADYVAFLAWLREAARQFKVAIHAYILLPDCFQLLASPSDGQGLGRMMQWLGRHYVPYFNAKYGRSGTLWQGRFRATVIEADAYLLPCTQYIELGAFRADLAMNPADYPWSSYLHHVGGKIDPLITDHLLYWGLGNTPFDREGAYRKMVNEGLSATQIRLLNEAVGKGWPLGSDTFKEALEKKSRRRVTPAKPGRPAKPSPARKHPSN